MKMQNPVDLYRHGLAKSKDLLPKFLESIVVDSRTTQYLFEDNENKNQKITLEVYKHPQRGHLAYYRDSTGLAIDKDFELVPDSLVSDAFKLKKPEQYYAIAAAQIDAKGQIIRDSQRKPKLLSLAEDAPNPSVPGNRKVCGFDDQTQLEIYRVSEGLEPALTFLDLEGKSTPFPCGESEIVGSKYVL